MFEKIAYIMYPVADMARATEFYGETLGLGAHTGSVEHGWVEFDLAGGGCIALTVHSGSPPGSGGPTAALEVADLAGLTDMLKARGVEFLSEGIKGPACRMAVCSDTEGNKLVLHQLDRK